MRSVEYSRIKQWLQEYSDVELIHKEYYQIFQTFLPINMLKWNSIKLKDLIGLPKNNQLNPHLDLPTFGLFDVWPEYLDGHSLGNPSFLSSDSFINANYDVGFAKHPRYCRADRHAHDYYELAYMYEGTSRQTIWVGGVSQQFTMREGTFLLIPPTVSHEVVVDDDSILLNVLLRKSTCETALLQNLPENSVLADFFKGVLYSESPSYLVMHTNNDAELQEYLFELLIENYGTGHYRRELANLKTSIFFLNLLSSTGVSINTYGDGWAAMDYIPAIINYIEMNYTTVTVQHLADRFNFSRAHISRVYKQHTGSTLADSIASVRIRRAQELLRRSDFSVEDICHRVGYGDVTNFIRRFKAHNAVTPFKYRLECKTGSVMA